MSLVYFTLANHLHLHPCHHKTQTVVIFMYMYHSLFIQSVVNIISISCLSVVNGRILMFLQQCCFRSRDYAVNVWGHVVALFLTLWGSSLTVLLPVLTSSVHHEVLFLHTFHQRFFFFFRWQPCFFFYDLFLLLFNYVYGEVRCVYLSASTLRAQRQLVLLELELHVLVTFMACVLGTELRSCTTKASIPNCWATSPAQEHPF